MITERKLEIKAWPHAYHNGTMYTYIDCRISEALANILDGLQGMRDDSALCQALSDHGDLCDLAARVAAVRMLRRKLADQDLTDAEHAALNALRADTCEWIRAEAGRALVELAEPLRNQDAAHDGRDAVSENIAGAKVRYMGDIKSIQGRVGVLTGEASLPDDVGAKCRGIRFDGDFWWIPMECPLEVVDAAHDGEVEG